MAAIQGMLWISATFLLDVKPCEDARVIRQGARYRLKECGGEGVKIFAAPGSLASWLEQHIIHDDLLWLQALNLANFLCKCVKHL